MTLPAHGANTGSMGKTSVPAVWACLVLAANPVRAYEARVSATFETQGYQLRDASGRLWNRRRLDVYLGLSLWRLLPEPKDPDERRRPHPQAYLTVFLRVGADVGDYSYIVSDLPAEDQDWPTGPKLDWLYGYLAVTGLLRGWLELRLGRQLQWTAMDGFLFDGLLGRLVFPGGVFAEVWGGRRVDGALAIDAPIYVLDGVDARDEPEHWLPMVGAAVGGTGPRWRFRLAYRKTFSWADSREAAASPAFEWPDGTYPAGLEEWATAEERVSAWLFGALWARRLWLFGGMAYSLVRSAVARARVGIRGKFGRHELSVEFLRHEPDFDGDSIFNVFNTEPFWAANAWYVLDWSRHWSGYLRATLGRSEPEGTGEPDAPVSWSPGAGVGVRYRSAVVQARADWYYQDGYGGRVFGVDVSWRHELRRGLLSWSGRLTVAHWAEQPLYAQLGGVGAGIACGLAWRVHPRLSLAAIVEDNFGDFYDAEFRVWLALSGALCTEGTCRFPEESW